MSWQESLRSQRSRPWFVWPGRDWDFWERLLSKLSPENWIRKAPGGHCGLPVWSRVCRGMATYRCVWEPEHKLERQQWEGAWRRPRLTWEWMGVSAVQTQGPGRGSGRPLWHQLRSTLQILLSHLSLYPGRVWFSVLRTGAILALCPGLHAQHCSSIDVSRGWSRCLQTDRGRIDWGVGICLHFSADLKMSALPQSIVELPHDLLNYTHEQADSSLIWEIRILASGLVLLEAVGYLKSQFAGVPGPSSTAGDFK